MCASFEGFSELKVMIFDTWAPEIYRALAVPARLPAQGFLLPWPPSRRNAGPPVPRVSGARPYLRMALVSRERTAEWHPAWLPKSDRESGKKPGHPFAVSVSCLHSRVTVTAREQPWNTVVWPPTRVCLSVCLSSREAAFPRVHSLMGSAGGDKNKAMRCTEPPGLPVPGGGGRLPQPRAGPGLVPARSLCPSMPVPAPVPFRRQRDGAGTPAGRSTRPGRWPLRSNGTGTSGWPRGGSPGKNKY